MFKRTAFLSLVVISLGHGMTPDKWRKLPADEKIKFHHSMLKGVSEKDSRTPLNLNHDSLKRKGASRGMASRKKSCIYGGWISKIRNGVCRHPHKERKNNGYNACGKKGLHRCNPVLFGEGNERGVVGSNPGRGMCVRASGDSSAITWSCIRGTYGSEDGSVDVKKFRNYLRNLDAKGREGRLLGEYLAMATEIVEEHCSERLNDFCAQYSQGGSCGRLKKSFFGKTGANPVLIACKNMQKFRLGNELEDSFKGVRQVLKIYYPLIEESRAWRDIREERMVVESFRESGFWPHQCNPLDIIQGNSGSLRRGRGCTIKKKRLEDKMIEQTPWGKMSLGERAEEIYRLANESYNDIKDAAENFVSKSGKFSFSEMVDGQNIFHEDVNPALASCFVYQETEGRVHPFSYNYSMCRRKHRSDSYGLGQIQKSTARGMGSVNNGSHLPLNTPEAKKFFWSGISDESMSGEEIYRYMGLSPKFQLELVLRILNEKAKRVNVRKGRNYSLNDLIQDYTGGGYKKYKKKIYNCMKCFERGRKASDCYYALEKCASSDCHEAKQRGDYSL